jgi:hypothetical protein
MNSSTNLQSTISAFGTGITSLEEDKRAVMNSRMGQYTPLAKTIQYQTQTQTQPSTQPSAQPQIQVQQQKTSNNWNDVNKKTQNVYYNPLPVMSNQ